jgi:hypothetical protein
VDKERGPLSETSLGQKRIAERRLVCEWRRVYVDICWLLSFLLAVCRSYPSCCVVYE